NTAAFGSAVAVNSREDQLFIGAPNELDDEGEVFVYHRIAGGIWAGPQELTPPDSFCALFGRSVAISGTTAVVGAPGWPNPCGWNIVAIGRVYVYACANGVWTETAELLADDGVPHDMFGSSVAIDGTTIAVGAPTLEAQGSVYVFDQDASGAWSQTQKLR